MKIQPPLISTRAVPALPEREMGDRIILKADATHEWVTTRMRKIWNRFCHHVA